MRTKMAQCGKVSWIYQSDAQTAVDHLKKQRGASWQLLNAYKCPRCGFFHVGHNRRLKVSQ